MRALSLSSASNLMGSLSSSKEDAFLTINRKVQTYKVKSKVYRSIFMNKSVDAELYRILPVAFLGWRWRVKLLCSVASELSK